MPDLQQVFDGLCALLKKHAKGLELVDALENSTAKQKKPALILQGKRVVTIQKRPPQKTYIAGVMLQKNHVGFYFMPLYCDPGNPPVLSPALQKALAGKACFHFCELTGELRKELDTLLAGGIRAFREREWL